MDEIEQVVSMVIPAAAVAPTVPQPEEPQKVELSPEEIEKLKKGEVIEKTKDPIKPKHAGGRPCEFCKRKDEILTYTKKYIESGKGDKPRMLYINELAMDLGVYRDIVTDWAHKTLENGSLEHPEFDRMIKQLESIQELRLSQRLLGRFNPTGAIFLLKTKHKYIETEKKLLAGDRDEPMRLEVEITEEKSPLHDE